MSSAAFFSTVPQMSQALPPERPTRDGSGAHRALNSGGGGERLGVAGTLLVVIGAALVLTAYTALDWYKHDSGQGASHFSAVHDALRALHSVGGANAISYAYFSWLAWVLLAVAVIGALVANLPTSAVRVSRLVGSVVALLGLIATALSIQLTSGDRVASTVSYADYVKKAGFGFYVGLAGFLVIGIGALIGPRRS
jgi:hypothetical protein